MALQVLGVEVGLCAVRTREFSISVFDGDDGALCSTSASSGSGRSSRSTGQNSPAALGADDMCWSVVSESNGLGLHDIAGLAVRRGDARLLLRHDAAGRHRSQGRRSTPAGRSWGNGLLARRGCGLGHHACGCGISTLVRRGGILALLMLGHGVDTTVPTRLRGLGLVVGRHVMRRIGGVRGARSTRRVRVASVHSGLHVCGGLQWR